MSGYEIYDGREPTILLLRTWPIAHSRYGTRDQIGSHSRGVEAARLTDGELLTMEGSGHIPNVRDPIKVNLAIREFVEAFAS